MPDSDVFSGVVGELCTGTYTQTDESGQRFVDEWGCINCLNRFDIDLDRIEEET